MLLSGVSDQRSLKKQENSRTMKLVVLIALFSFCCKSTQALAYSSLVSDVQDEQQYHNIGTLQQQHDSQIPPLSPACWRNAMQAMTHLAGQSAQEAVLGKALCSRMAPEHYDILALEMARCKMDNLGQPMFIGDAAQACKTEPFTTRNAALVATCLASLSVAGANAYIHFASSVHNSCNHMVMELLSQHQEETSILLTQNSEKVASRLEETLQGQEEFWIRAQQREQEMLEHHSRLVTNIWESKTMLTSTQEMMQDLMDREAKRQEFSIISEVSRSCSTVHERVSKSRDY